jgi:DNA helicase-2/ATP-dependent DNA helicase PcrA
MTDNPVSRSSYELSPTQELAVECTDPAIVVVASAGSGKTEVAASRVERLLTESANESFRILALSYTQKAAQELEGRFRERLGDMHTRADTDTIHGFAHALLRQHGTKIGLPVEPEVLTRNEDRAELLARWLVEEGRDVPNDFASVFSDLDLARAKLEDAPYKTEWNAALLSAGAIDYQSMLERATELLALRSARRQLSRLYAHIIVDEAQNLTRSQYELITALVGPPSSDEPHVPILLVGDDKQSIVSFAGADPGLIGQFESEYNATKYELTQNFRSAELIVSLADRVAQDLDQIANPNRETLDYAAKGQVLFQSAADESSEGDLVADWVVGLLDNGLPSEALAPGEPERVLPEEIAVLGRSAASLRGTQRALEARGHSPALASSPDDWLTTVAAKVAFEMIALFSASSHQSTHWQLARLITADEESVRSRESLAQTLEESEDPSLCILAGLCHHTEPDNFFDELAELEPPSDAPDEWLSAWEADRSQLVDSWKQFQLRSDAAARTWGNFRLHVSRVQRGDDLDRGVRLLTVHKAQGREYRAVAVVGLNDGQLPDFRASTSEEVIAELRTFYVALSRPARLLLLTRAESRTTRYGPRSSEPSPFLKYLAGSDR